MSVNRYKKGMQFVNELYGHDSGRSLSHNSDQEEKGNILLIEDDPLSANSFAEFMRQNGLYVDICTTGAQAIQCISKKYQLVILDMKLSDMNGLNVLTRLSAADLPPIICWTGASTTQDEIQAWNTGIIIDFISKPTAASCLLARILNRMALPVVNNVKSTTIQVRGLILDMKQRLVTVNDIAVKLAPKEYALLECLAKNPDATLCKKSIIGYLYKHEDRIPEIKILDVLVCKVRKKIAEYDPCYEYLSTKWSVGYTWHSNPPLNPKTVYLFLLCTYINHYQVICMHYMYIFCHLLYKI